MSDVQTFFIFKAFLFIRKKFAVPVLVLVSDPLSQVTFFNFYFFQQFVEPPQLEGGRGRAPEEPVGEMSVEKGLLRRVAAGRRAQWRMSDSVLSTGNHRVRE